MRIIQRHLLVICAAAVVAAIGVDAAPAQPKPAETQQSSPLMPPNALQGFSQNRDQPVKINADALDVREHSKVATFTGNVKVVQGDTTMRCKTLVVYYDGDSAPGPSVKAAAPGPEGSQQIRRMEAKGGVLVNQKDQTATGDSAIYDMPSNTVTLIAPPGGSVAITQGGNVMKGQTLVVDLTSSVSHLKGGGQGVEGLIIPTHKADAKGAGDHPAPKAQPSTAPKGLY